LRSPSLETQFVNVVTTSGHAVDYRFVFDVELITADWTIVINRLAIAVVVFGFSSQNWGGMVEYLDKF